MDQAFDLEPSNVKSLLWHFVAACFMMAFQLMANLLILNMFIMIVVSSYELTSDPDAGLNQMQILEFQEAWLAMDKDKTGYIHWEQVELLVRGLPNSILGVEDGRDRHDLSAKEAAYYRAELNLRTFKTARQLYTDNILLPHEVRRQDGQIHFHRVLLAINRLNFKRKQNGQNVLDVSSIHAGSPERHVMEDKAAFILARNFRRVRTLTSISIALKAGTRDPRRTMSGDDSADARSFPPLEQERALQQLQGRMSESLHEVGQEFKGEESKLELGDGQLSSELSAYSKTTLL